MSMMRAPPRFTYYTLHLTFLRAAHDTVNSTTHLSLCKERLYACGFAAAAGAAFSRQPFCFRGDGKSQDSPPFLLKPCVSQAFCRLRTSALNSNSVSTNLKVEEETCIHATLIDSQPCVKHARKDTLHQDTLLTVEKERCVDTNAGKLKASESDIFFETCDHSEESQVTQQNFEASIENEAVIYAPSQACEEGEPINSKTCIEKNNPMVSSSSSWEDKEEMDGQVYHRKIKIPRRSKANPEALATHLKLNSCSKFADLHGAIQIYDKVKRDGQVHLSIHDYNVLLYICSGAASGSLSRKKRSGEGKKQESTSLQSNHLEYNEIESLREQTTEWVYFSPEDMQLALKRGADILEDMLQQGMEPNEATFLSVVRFAVARNDGDLAFETIKLMVSSGIPPKLRSYGPPLLCFCESNQADKAFKVDDHMQQHGVLPDESMLDSLLRVSIDAGLQDNVYSLLQRLRKSVRALMPKTVKTIEKWFNSEAAASVRISETPPSKEQLRQATVACGGGWHGLGWLGKGVWQSKRTNISKTGSCMSCGEMLCTIDLDPKETDGFANSVAKLASKREEQPQGFKVFQEWLDRNGPFDAIIDGANVGLYNPQVYRGFSLMMLNAVVKAARSGISTRKPPLVVVHSRHQSRLMSEQIVSKWRKGKMLYFTPRGSNDDWFWLYAAVKCNCLLITNDQMRDHIFELLGTDFFPKWKERHQVQFTFKAEKLELHLPPPYSIVVQESEKGSWHVPQAGGDDIEEPREWLCVTRA